MTVYYLDSSAWVKRYVYESGSSFVAKLFSSNESLACSALGLVEITAAFARKQKTGDLTRVQMDLLRKQSRWDWQRFYRIPLLAPVIESALRLAQTEALRGADALHLASAILLAAFLNQSGNDLVFVGSDQELNDAARQLGLSVVDPSNVP